MLRRSFLVSCLLSAGALAACAGVLGNSTAADDDVLSDASTGGDGGPSTGDSSTPGEDGSPEAGPDAADDAPNDAANDAADDADACTSLQSDSNCGRCGNDCGTAATCEQGKCRFAVAGTTCPAWGLAYGVTTESIYWTEMCAGSGAIRRCPMASGCPTLPGALYTGGNDSLPCGVVAANGSDGKEYFFNTDNQGPNNNRLWRTLFDGNGRTDWGGTNAGGPGAIVTNGTNIWWGTSGVVYRSAVSTTGSTPVLNANPSPTTSSAPQSVALDAVNVYAARQAMLGEADGVVACPIAGDCTTTGEIQIFTGGNASAIVSDGVNVFVSQRANGVDNVYRCSVAVGCDAGAAPIWTANVAVNPARPIPLALDGNNVYINSRSGDLLACPKNAATCATPKLLHPNVNAGSMLVRDGYLYWTESNGLPGVYRTKP